MDKIGELKNCVYKVTKDMFKFFEKNNMASGVRARKKLQNLKRIAQEIRISIQIRKKDHLQKKKAREATSVAIFAGRFLLRKKISLRTDLIETHKNNDFFKIHFSVIRLRKNQNRCCRILNYFNKNQFFLDRMQKFGRLSLNLFSPSCYFLIKELCHKKRNLLPNISIQKKI